MQDILHRFWTDLLERTSGPLALRFYLQPTIATILAVRDGLADARSGRAPYLWTVLSDPAQRRGRLREGLRATGKILVVAVVLDLVYQVLVLKAFRPLETVIVVILLGFVPYALVRGPTARLAAR